MSTLSNNNTTINNSNNINKGDVSMSTTREQRELVFNYAAMRSAKLLVNMPKEVLVNLAEIAQISLFDLGKKYTKEQLVEFMTKKGFILEPFYNSVDLVSYDNGASYHMVSKKKYNKLGILNEEHVRMAHLLKAEEQLMFTTVEPYKTYVVRTAKDLAYLYILENTKTAGELKANLTKGDAYVPNMEVLGQYFDAVAITEEFVKQTRNNATLLSARKEVVYLKPRKNREVIAKTIDNTKAKDIRQKADTLKSRHVDTNDVIDTVQLKIDNVGYDEITGKPIYNVPTKDTELKAEFAPIGGSEAADRYGVWTSYIHPESKEEKHFRYFADFVILDMTVNGKLDETEKKKIQMRLDSIYQNGIELNMKHPVKGYEIKGLFTQAVRTPSQGRQGSIWLMKISDKNITDRAEISRLRIAKKIELAGGINYFGETLEKNKVDNTISLMFSTSKRIYNEDQMKDRLKTLNVKIIHDPDIETDEVFRSLQTEINKVTVTKNGRTFKEDKVTHTMDNEKLVARPFKRTPHDGQSHASFDFMAEIAMIEGLISRIEYNTLIKLFEKSGRSLRNMKQYVIGNRKIEKMFFKVPSLYQIRGGMVKGTLVLADIKEWAKGTDYEDAQVILGDSSIKYPISKDGNNKYTLPIETIFSYLRVCAHSKNPKRGQLSQQIIQGLELDANTIKGWSSTEIKRLVSVTKSHLAAILFLGSYFTEDDEVNITEEDDTMTKLMIALEDNPNMLFTPYAQNKLFSMIRTRLTDIRLGRLPFDIFNQFVFTDPRTLFNLALGTHNNELGKDENVWNDNEGEYAVTRHPYVYKASIDVLKMIIDDELWFYRNVIVLNAYGTTLQRLSGADTDGDKLGITNVPEFVAATKNHKLPFLYTEKPKGKKVVYTEQVEMSMYRNGINTSNVGPYTNKAMILRDIQQCVKKPIIKGITVDFDGNKYSDLDKRLDELQMIIDQVIGKEIDKEKTGEDVLIMDVYNCLTAKPMCHKDVDVMFKTTEEIADMKEGSWYMSDSPLAQNYIHVSSFVIGGGSDVKEVNNKHAVTILDEKLAAVGYDPLYAWSAYVNMGKVEYIYDQIEEYVRAYNVALRNLIIERNAYAEELGNDKSANEKADKEYKVHFTELFKKFKGIFDSFKGYGCTDKDIAYTVYKVTEDIRQARKDSKLVGTSCPWATVFEGMRDLNLLAGSRVAVTRVHVAEDVDSIIVNNQGDIIAEGDDGLYVVRPNTKIKAGRYAVVHMNGKALIEVPRETEDFVRQREALRKAQVGTIESRPNIIINVYGYNNDKIKLTSEEFIANFKEIGILNSRNGSIAVTRLADGSLKQIGLTNVADKNASKVKLHSIKASLINTVVALKEISHTDKSIKFAAVIVGSLEDKIAKAEAKKAEPKPVETVEVKLEDVKAEVDNNVVNIILDDETTAVDNTVIVVNEDYELVDSEEDMTNISFDDESLRMAQEIANEWLNDEGTINIILD